MPPLSTLTLSGMNTVQRGAEANQKHLQTIREEEMARVHNRRKIAQETFKRTNKWQSNDYIGKDFSVYEADAYKLHMKSLLPLDYKPL